LSLKMALIFTKSSRLFIRVLTAVRSRNCLETRCLRSRISSKFSSNSAERVRAIVLITFRKLRAVKDRSISKISKPMLATFRNKLRSLIGVLRTSSLSLRKNSSLLKSRRNTLKSWKKTKSNNFTLKYSHKSESPYFLTSKRQFQG